MMALLSRGDMTGQALRIWREQHKLTQMALAGLLGLGLRTVVRWEGGGTIPDAWKLALGNGYLDWKLKAQKKRQTA